MENRLVVGTALMLGLALAASAWFAYAFVFSGDALRGQGSALPVLGPVWSVIAVRMFQVLCASLLSVVFAYRGLHLGAWFGGLLVVGFDQAGFVWWSSLASGLALGLWSVALGSALAHRPSVRSRRDWWRHVSLGQYVALAFGFLDDARESVGVFECAVAGDAASFAWGSDDEDTNALAVGAVGLFVRTWGCGSNAGDLGGSGAAGEN